MKTLTRLWLGLVVLCAPALAEELPILGIANVGLRVSDLEKARVFYRSVCGMDEAFVTRQADGSVLGAYYKVNDRQFIAIQPGLRDADAIAMTHIALKTEQIEKLHAMIAALGLKPTAIRTGPDGNRVFSIGNLPGQELDRLEFLQYVPGSLSENTAGKFLNERRLSKHLEHAGIVTTDHAKAYDFYVKVLGFQDRYRRLTYDRTRVILEQLRMPGPNVEFVELFNQTGMPGPVTRARAKGPIHFACEVPDATAVFKETIDRGLDPARKPPRFAWDNRYNTNIFDPDGTRVEYMSEENPAHPTPLVVYTPKGQ